MGTRLSHRFERVFSGKQAEERKFKCRKKSSSRSVVECDALKSSDFDQIEFPLCIGADGRGGLLAGNDPQQGNNPRLRAAVVVLNRH